MRTVAALLGDYQHIIESTTLHHGAKGTFDVTVDGEVLYSKHAEGRHAEPGEVLERFVARHGTGVAVYGS